MKKSILQLKRKLDERQPEYISRRGKPLWIDEDHYDNYTRSTGAKILRGADGRFWGYTNSENAVEYRGIMEVIE